MVEIFIIKWKIVGAKNCQLLLAKLKALDLTEWTLLELIYYIMHIGRNYFNFYFFSDYQYLCF